MSRVVKGTEMLHAKGDVAEALMRFRACRLGRWRRSNVLSQSMWSAIDCR